jgi:hypothetical protein
MLSAAAEVKEPKTSTPLLQKITHLLTLCLSTSTSAAKFSILKQQEEIKQ